MRIGIDARPITSNPTGIGYYLLSILDILQKIDNQNFYFLIANSKIDYKIRNSRWVKIEGGFNGRLMGTLWVQGMIPPLAKKLSLDIFWGTRHQLPLLLDPKIKSVLNVYDLVHLFFPETMPLPNLILERLLLRLSLNRANIIITTSKSTQKDIISVYHKRKNKISVIYPGVPNFIDTCEKTDKQTFTFSKKYFLFVGTVEPRKNFDRLFDAYCNSEPAKHGYHLVIVGGKGWKNNYFIKKIKKHPLRSFVHFTGYVSRSQLKDLYENAIALIFPSIYEGFGFPILEAMHCGTPVICSNISSMPEVSNNAAIKINPFSNYEILQGLLRIINDSNLRRRLSIEGKIQASKFSWENCAKATLNDLKKVISII
jgi:glycosyltransferase involved in cell wall biosynthesis